MYWSKILNAAPPEAEAPKKPRGIGEDFVTHFAEGANKYAALPVAGLTEMAGNALGIDAVEQAGKNMAANAEAFIAEKEQEQPSQKFRDIQGIGDAAQWAGEQITEFLPQAAIMAVSGGAGALAGRAGAVAKGVTDASRVMKAATRGAQLATAAESIGMETATIYQGQEEGKKDKGKAALYGTAAGLLDTAVPNYLLQKTGFTKFLPGMSDLGKEAAETTVKKLTMADRLKSVAKITAGGAAAETPQEGAQTVLERIGSDQALYSDAAKKDGFWKVASERGVQAAVNPEAWNDIVESMAAGGLIGGVMGGGMSAVSNASDAMKKEPAPPPAIDEGPVAPPMTPDDLMNAGLAQMRDSGQGIPDLTAPPVPRGPLSRATNYVPDFTLDGGTSGVMQVVEPQVVPQEERKQIPYKGPSIDAEFSPVSPYPQSPYRAPGVTAQEAPPAGPIPPGSIDSGEQTVASSTTVPAPTIDGGQVVSAPPVKAKIALDFNEIRRPDGAIGTQGVDSGHIADVLNHVAGMNVNSDATMRELVDAFKADPAAQQKLREFMDSHPLEGQQLPDGTISITDGHHRAFLLNELGDATIPSDIKDYSGASQQIAPDLSNNTGKGEKGSRKKPQAIDETEAAAPAEVQPEAPYTGEKEVIDVKTAEGETAEAVPTYHGPLKALVDSKIPTKDSNKSVRTTAKLIEAHGKDTLNQLAKEHLISFPGGGVVEITKKGRQWLSDNPEAPEPKKPRTYTAPTKEEAIAKITEKLTPHAGEDSKRIAEKIADEYIAKKAIGNAWLAKKIKEAGWIEKQKGGDLSGQEGTEAEVLETEEAAPVASEDRRHNEGERKRIEHMTPDEMRAALLVDDLTGLGNRRAYEESPVTEFEVSADADSLKWVNDNMGHQVGDELLRAVGRAFKDEHIEAFHMFHISGDEFILKGNNQDELNDAMELIQNRLDNAILTYTAPDGTVITKKGIGVSYGIGTDAASADADLQRNKEERARTGKRPERGNEPAGVVRQAPAGREAEGEAAGEEVAPQDALETATVEEAIPEPAPDLSVNTGKGEKGAREAAKEDSDFVKTKKEAAFQDGQEDFGKDKRLPPESLRYKEEWQKGYDSAAEKAAAEPEAAEYKFPHPFIKTLYDSAKSSGNGIPGHTIWSLAGDKNKQLRADIVSALLGEKVNKSDGRVGITNLERYAKTWLFKNTDLTERDSNKYVAKEDRRAGLGVISLSDDQQKVLRGLTNDAYDSLLNFTEPGDIAAGHIVLAEGSSESSKDINARHTALEKAGFVDAGDRQWLGGGASKKLVKAIKSEAMETVKAIHGYLFTLTDNGVPFENFQKTPAKISSQMPGDGWTYAKSGEKEYYSNGHFIFEGKPPVGSRILRNEDEPADADRVMPDLKTATTNIGKPLAARVAWNGREKYKDASPMAVFDVNDKPLGIDYSYYMSAFEAFPGAELFMKPDFDAERPGPIAIVVDGELKGAIMPMRSSGVDLVALREQIANTEAAPAETAKPPESEPVTGKAADELAAMSDDDIANMLIEAAGVDTENLTVKEERKRKERLKNGLQGGRAGRIETNAEKELREAPAPTLAKVGAEAAKSMSEAMKAAAAAFGVDTGKLITFPPHLDKDAYAKARPHLMAAWAQANEAGHSLKEYVNYVFESFGKLIDNFMDYMAYFIGELRGKENFEEEQTALTVEESEAETPPVEAEAAEPINLDANTGKGEKGARKKAAEGEEKKTRRKLTEQEKVDKAAAEKAAAERKAHKESLGNFQNVGYVYDPEGLNERIRNKAPKSAAKIIVDAMTPANVWRIQFADDSTPGTPRLHGLVQKYFTSFSDYVKGKIPSPWGVKAMDKLLDNWMDNKGGTIEELKKMADDYGKALQPVIDAFKGKDITTIVGTLQETLLPGARNIPMEPYENEAGVTIVGGTKFPDSPYDVAEENNGPLRALSPLMGSYRSFYDLLTKNWSKLLADENEILLSEIDVHSRTRNKEVIRVGLPEYGVQFKTTEDFNAPFSFNGVGFGTEGWINQEERNRVIPAGYNGFKDLAATIKAPDNGMSIGGQLAVQFANLGHKAKGAAAAYFPNVRTINFTRDSGDGTMSHEWAHGLHDLADGSLRGEINSVVKTMEYVFDFEAGQRLVADLLAKDSPILKRIISSKRQQRIEAVKDAITNKYAKTVKKETDYYKTAKNMDADYTANHHEMWARSFEAFVYDHLAGRNNYLVNDFVAAGRVGGKSAVGTRLVYPAGLEREEFNRTIQHMIDGISWSETGMPSMKEDYESIEANHEKRMKEELDKLLATVEARYKEIWSHEASEDGLFWYRYNVTAFGPMMQPDGYVAYDKEYTGEEQGGKGAVGYKDQLHPDQVLDFSLEGIQYVMGDNTTRISQVKGAIYDLQGDGAGTLAEAPTGNDTTAKGSGDLRDDDDGSSGPGEGGTFTPGTKRGKPGDGEDGSSEGVHTPGPGDFRITDDTLNDPKTVEVRFLNNLAAVRVLKLVEEEDRSPTSLEKETLSKYSGWGGMSEAFSHYPEGSWVARSALIKDLLEPSEIRSAESSSTTSYYTPIPIARFMWRLAERLGLKGGNVLDPAFGANGTFTGTMPSSLAQAVTVQGIEQDALSTRIAAKLYELASIDNKGFQDSKKPVNRFDLSITNVPFENITPSDPRHNKAGHMLHNYYINKMIDLTAPGGLAMAISTTGTLDKPGTHLAEYDKKADFVGAIRLPSGIYSSTQVATDILVFRKKIEGSKYKGLPIESWNETGIDEPTGLYLNKYFLEHPEMIAGKLEAITGRWGDEKLRIAPEGDLQRKLEDIAAAFPANIVESVAVKAALTIDDLIPAPGTVKEGGIYINAKGEVATKESGEEVKFPVGTNAEKKKAEIAKGYVGILDAVFRALRAQKGEEGDVAIKKEQAALKKAYDAFFKKFGALNKQENLKVFTDATDSSWVVALEEYDPDEDKVTKLADIFTEKIVGMEERPTRAENDEDALSMSLDEFGYPNPDYMAKLRGTDADTILKGLGDKVIDDPETGFLVTTDEYLSGNVKRKLALAKDMAIDSPEYEKHVRLLEAALPADIPAHRITARIGASWIDPEHISDFIVDKMNMGSKLTPVLNFHPITHEWTLSFKGRENRWKGEVKAETRRALDEYKDSVEANMVWGTDRMNFFKLVENALEGKRPTVTFYDPIEKKSFFDPVATQAAEAKLADIQTEFQRWLFDDNQRADEAVTRFNEKINTTVPPQSDGSHLTFPGKSLAVLTPKEVKQFGITDKMAFYPHQMNTTWKYIRFGNIYLAHEVGAGKTISMALIAMEAKRLRGKKKVLYVTLNDSTLGQAQEEFKKLYPLSNIQVVRVSTQSQRQKLQLQKIALNNSDVIIMTQDDLNRIALSPEASQVFIQEQVDELRAVLEEAKASGARLLEQDIQTRLRALEEKLKNPGVHAEAKAENLYFDDLGIDLMIVDEAHLYKNVPYVTRLTRITGLNPKGSPTSQDFFYKAQYLNAQFPKNDAIVLASGTPLTNSIAEMYNIQRLLQPKEVKRQGLWNFDRWIATYGDIGSQLEWDGARGRYKTITTNRRIVNAGRLLATAYQNIDTVRAKDTPIRRPEIRGGEPVGVAIQPNPYVEDYKQIILSRCANIEADPKEATFEGRRDNMLRIISNMSKVAIDQRLDSRYANTEEQEDSKIAKSSAIIFKEWEDQKLHKGVQLVFADIGVPKRYVKDFKYKEDDEDRPEGAQTDGKTLENMNPTQIEAYEERRHEYENAGEHFNVYDGLKAKLVSMGIPAEQIAFIHDADHSNKEKKKANLRNLFKRVNNGDVRIMIGSTSKAGTGVNVQKRVSAIHHLDIWWNYSAWEQRNGRGLRAGNIYTDIPDGVAVYNYVTETTVDATRWDKVFAKGKVLNAVLGGDINIDIIEDISDATMSAKQMAAMASGDPLMSEQATLFQAVQSLRFEQAGFLDTVRKARMDLASTPDRIERHEKSIAKYDRTRAILEQITAVQFVGDKRTLVLEKHGKEIAEALLKAVGANKNGWTADRWESLLVFGTFKERTVDIPAKKEGDKPTKGKEYDFTPLPVKANIMGEIGDPLKRRIEITGKDVDNATRKLAEISGKPGNEKVEVSGNVSRTVTEYISNLKSWAENSKDSIAKLEADKPKLEEVVSTPWPKAQTYEEKQLALNDVERRMAERGQSVGNPATGIPIASYQGSVAALEDVAPKALWRMSGGVIFPNDGDNKVAFSADTKLQDVSMNRQTKFNPQALYNLSYGLNALQVNEMPSTPKYKPVGYTTNDGVTKFWIGTDMTVDPKAWRLADRVYPGIAWHFDSSYDNSLIGVKDGKRVARVKVQMENNTPEGIKGLIADQRLVAPDTGTTLNDITSVVPMALKELAKIGRAGAEALPHLITVGKAVYAAGADTYGVFVNRMKDSLVNLWETFKSQMLAVWQNIKKYAKDERGLFAPFGGDIRDHKGQFSDLTDKKAKIEIDDSGAKLLVKRETYGGKAVYERADSLGAILEHPVLFKRFPKIKNLNVDFRVDPDEGEARGSFTPFTDRKSEGLFDLDEQINVTAPTAEAGMETLLHEIQHYIQEKSGFAMGGSPYGIEDTGAGSRLRGQIDDLRDRRIDVLDEIEWRLSEGEDEYGEEIVAAREKVIDLDGDIEFLQSRYIQEYDPFETYKRLSGEEEARRVAARANMTAAERKANPYAGTDIENPDRLITHFGRGDAMSADSSAFKKWFGNSQVVDADGKALKVYHGTKSDFDAFDRSRAKTAGGKIGFFFTPNTEAAGGWTRKAGDSTGANVMPVYLTITNPLVVDDFSWVGDQDPKKYEKKALAGGHDGILIKASAGEKSYYNGDVWVAFQPTQIKSAMSNSGEYGPNNPNIMMSVSAVREAITDAAKSIDLKTLGETVNPLDFSRSREWFDDHSSDAVKEAVGYLFANPFFQAERDPQKRVFFDHGGEREVNRMQTSLNFMGWDANIKPEEKNFAQRAMDYLTKWQSGDKQTKWEQFKNDFAGLTADQKKMYEKLFVEGDRWGASFATIGEAQKIPNLKAVDAQSFAVYAKVRDFIDNHVAEVRLKELEKLLTSMEMPKAEVDKHISDYRNEVKQRRGWLTRSHGEGDYVVNVYRTVKSLDFNKVGPEKAIMKFYPGVEGMKWVYGLAAEHGVAISISKTGAVIAKVDPGESLDPFVKAAKGIMPKIIETVGPLKVKVYAKYVESKSQARKLSEEIPKDYKPHIPFYAVEGEEFATEWKHSDALSESMYADMKNDMAMEAALMKTAERAFKKGEISTEEYQDMRAELVRNTAEVLMGRAAGKYQIKRAPYLIEGYQTDNVNQLFQDYMTGVAGMLSKAQYAKEQFAAYRDAKSEVKPWAEKYVKDSLRNMGRGDRLSANARAFASLWYLGLKPASVVINLTQVWTIGVAELGRFTKNPVATIGKAQKDILSGKMSKEEEDIFHTAIYRTQEMETVMAELTGHGEGPTGKASNFLHQVTSKGLALFQKGEIFNRKTMILAAYRTMREKGMRPEEALAEAVKINGAVNFEMGRHNLPGFARNPIGRTLYSLQSFAVNQLNWIYNRATSGEKDQMIALLRYAGMMALFGGMAAAAGGDELDRILKRFTGRSFKLDFQEWTRKNLKKYGTGGELLDGFLWHGLPSLAGVNISNSIRLQLPVISSLTQGESGSEAVAGVFGGLYQKATRGTDALTKGEYYRAAENFAPEVVAGGMRAYRQATEGATTTRGKPVYDEKGQPVKYSGLDVVKRVAGFQPIKQSRLQEVTQEGRELTSFWNEKKSDTLTKLRLASTMDEIREANREIMKFNAKLNGSQAKGLILPISAKSMKNARRPKPDKRATEWKRNVLD